MRITGQYARQVSEYAHEISNGRVGVAQIGGDVGSGSRVIDGNTQTVWLGQPRHAAAYYVGQVDALREAHGITGTYPHVVWKVRTELLEGDRRAEVLEWYERGKVDGAYRAGQSR